MSQTFKINSVLGGWGVSEYFIQEGQFLSSLGIDPEMPKDSSGTKPSGLLRPTATEKFSGTEITGAPLWIETNNKTTDTLVYSNDGKIHLITSALAMGTALNGGAAITGASGNGFVFYNNYYYFAMNTDIGRYGPMSGSPTLDTNWWSSDLSKTALSNKTYPSIKGVQMPNHPMFVNPANTRIYFLDVDSNNVGIVSMIKTKKVTVEGDTDDTIVPSSYKVLDLYYGWWPTAICNVGTELAIGVIDGTDTTIKQGNAKVAFWSTNPSDTAPNRFAPLPDPLITAMKNVNGQLYVFSGSASGGMRVSRYIGGESFEELYYFDDQVPPLQGAVDFLINRIIFGASTTTPAVSGSVMALGSKVRNLSMGVHNILKSTAGATTPFVTSCKYLLSGGVSIPITGWKDNTGGGGSIVAGLDKASATYSSNIWRSQIMNFGKQGNVAKIRIPLAQAVAANQILTVKVYVDGGSSNETAFVINNTNYPSQRFVEQVCQVNFNNDIFIELVWSGTALMTVALPIEITCNFVEK